MPVQLVLQPGGLHRKRFGLTEAAIGPAKTASARAVDTWRKPRARAGPAARVVHPNRRQSLDDRRGTSSKLRLSVRIENVCLLGLLAQKRKY